MIDMKEVRSFEIQTTRSCNMRCSYCYENKPKHSKVSDQTIDTLIKIYKENDHINYLSIFGGESMLPDVKESINKLISGLAALDKPIKVHITTNGYDIENMLDIYDKMVKSFKFTTIQVSLDGCKEAHDSKRLSLNGEGTFDKVLQNLICLLNRYSEYEDRVNIVTHHVLSADTVKYLADTALLDTSILNKFPLYGVDYACYHGFRDSPFDENEYRAQLDTVYQLYLDGLVHPFIADEVFKLNSLTLYDNRFRYCSAGKTHLSVDINGDVPPCHFFDKSHGYNFYNINTGELKTDIQDKMMNDFYTHNEEPKTRVPGRDCSSCRAKSICAYCAADSLTSTGDNKSVGHTSCHIAYTLVNWILDKLPDLPDNQPTDEELTALAKKYADKALLVEKNPEMFQELLKDRFRLKVLGVRNI